MNPNPADPNTFTLAPPDIAPWRAGNTQLEGVWHFDSGLPGKKLLITALIHGNELCGAWALNGLLERAIRPARGSLTLAYCNLAAFDTYDPAQLEKSRFVDEDLNRQWQADRMAAGNTAERRRAAALKPWVDQADWLLDIHSMHEANAPLMLTGPHPRNVALARQMAATADMVADAGHQDGTRMRDFGHFGLPDSLPNAQGEGLSGQALSLLIECGFHADIASKAVALNACARFLQVSGCLGDGVDPLQDWLHTQSAAQRLHRVTEAVVAQSMAFKFEVPVHGLATIAQGGSLLATDDSFAWRTPYDNCTLIMPSLRQLRPGVTVARLARTEML